MVSEVLELELYRAPKFIVDFYESLPDVLIKKVVLTDEVINLAGIYITENVVGKTSRADC